MLITRIYRLSSWKPIERDQDQPESNPVWSLCCLSQNLLCDSCNRLGLLFETMWVNLFVREVDRMVVTLPKFLWCDPGFVTTGRNHGISPMHTIGKCTNPPDLHESDVEEAHP